MLVITRKIGEVVYIGDDIRVMVVSIQGGSKVRLGIVAPDSVEIMREELLDRPDRKEGDGCPK